jgi:carboxypeptidase Q
MKMRILLPAAVLLTPFALSAAEPVDLDVVTRIRDEGLHRSQVMETAAYLCDVIGPRLTASPAARRANEWTRDRFASWGLSAAHLESWGPFGPGWTLERSSLHMLTPTTTPLVAWPKAWSPGTGGVVRGKALHVSLEKESDLAAHKGKLKGRFLLLSAPVAVQDEDKAPLSRFSEADLAELGRYPIPKEPTIEEERKEELRDKRFRRLLRAFLSEEGVVGSLESRPWPGTVRVGSASSGEWRAGESRGVPAFMVLPEQYNRLVRLVEKGVAVDLEAELRVSFDERDTMGYTTLAEIPGGDRKDELVLAGAHLDSWHVGTGATDNGAGVSVVMEAARILKALGLTPRRTIRFALWTGEEQTYGSSAAYVSRYLASRAAPADAAESELALALQKDPAPLQLKPGHAKLSGYFNVDNGTGRIRGIFAQDNAALAPIFEAWMRPFADLGVTQLSLRPETDTDHEPFDDVGIPAFQFIQDDVEYSTRTWHSNLDTYDRLKRDDLVQASIVLAGFLYDAAMRDEMLPRKPLPRR